jgi:serine/threonine protein kinase
VEEVFPQRFGPFVLLRLLGSGGMGKAYLAKHVSKPGLLALKRMHEHLLDEPTLKRRFQHEFAVAEHVRHPNVAGLMWRGEQKEEPFFATQFVVGLALSAIIEEIELRRVERIPLVAGLHVAVGLAAGLEAVHTAVHTETGAPLELVHRDMGARNVILGDDGAPRIIDLGLGRSALADWHTAANLLAGSPDYMAPEQAQGKQADRRADVYATAVAIWELLAGKKRIREPTVPLRIQRALEAVPEPLVMHRREASRSLERLLKEAMEPSVADRLASATLLRQGLERELAALGGDPEAATTRAWMERTFPAQLARERHDLPVDEPETALLLEAENTGHETRILFAYDSRRSPAPKVERNPTVSGRLAEDDSIERSPRALPPPAPQASMMVGDSQLLDAARAYDDPSNAPSWAPARDVVRASGDARAAGSTVLLERREPATSEPLRQIVVAFVLGILLVIVLALAVGMRIGSATVEPIAPPGVAPGSASDTPAAPGAPMEPAAPGRVGATAPPTEPAPDEPIPLDVLSRRRELAGRIKDLRRARGDNREEFHKRLTQIGARLSVAKTMEQLDDVEALLARLERL